MRGRVSVVLLALSLLGAHGLAQGGAQKKLPQGAKVYVAPMPDGFDSYIKAALEKKKAPIEVVADKAQAEYMITGSSESQKAGAAKKVLMLDWRSTEEASIQVSNIASGEVVFAYAVHLQSSNHGKQSSAESCAKHIKDEAISREKP